MPWPYAPRSAPDSRTAEGAAYFDRRLVRLVAGSPGFARQARG
jgi:hypothetical protein